MLFDNLFMVEAIRLVDSGFLTNPFAKHHHRLCRTAPMTLKQTENIRKNKKKTLTSPLVARDQLKCVFGSTLFGFGSVRFAC